MYSSLFIIVYAFVLIDIVNCDGLSNAPMDTRKYFSDVEEDLTKVTWVHRCNSRADLEAALNSDVMMIEADIISGHLESDTGGEPIPVMGHPPSTTSDISLEQFLHRVLEKRAGKGIKLDFKSTAIFKASENVLEEFLAKAEVDFPVWINADILRGPGVPESRNVVDAKYFLETCVDKFPIAYISPGWAVDTTSARHLRYEKKHVDEMTTVLSEANVVHGVTFPVHSGIASNSVDVLTKLIKTSVEGTTLTLWSGKNEWVDYGNLRKLIEGVGREKVYIDMPKEMLEKLNKPDESESKGAATTNTVGIANMLLVLIGLVCTILPSTH
ncbi:protein FAM151B [Macrosteles quadrilineatus]|uniref:protein FAM151B n=1 Tax=Macrosteles quadrilineatus TaxID=74068 RepID=UPI0023E1194F|nr:protein FAM151B [Macrosteles quadrilineatus]